MNFLIITVLRRYHFFYGDCLKVECPTGSGQLMNLKDVSDELCDRVVKLFEPDENGHRPCHGMGSLVLHFIIENRVGHNFSCCKAVS